MKCPDCQADLKKTDFRGIDILACSSCQGHWFGRDELRKAKDMTDEDLRWLDFDPFGRAAGPFSVSADKKRCPGCGDTLDGLTYAESGVIIGRCLRCHGIWVPYGEFEKIIAYLENKVSSKPAAEFVRDSLKQFLEIAAGEEDVADEIKDFLVVLKLSELRWGVEHPKVAEAVKTIYEYLPFL